MRISTPHSRLLAADARLPTTCHFCHLRLRLSLTRRHSDTGNAASSYLRSRRNAAQYTAFIATRGMRGVRVSISRAYIAHFFIRRRDFTRPHNAPGDSFHVTTARMRRCWQSSVHIARCLFMLHAIMSAKAFLSRSFPDIFAATNSFSLSGSL